MEEGQQAMTEDVITPQGDNQARPHPVKAAMENLDVQAHAIFRDGYTPSQNQLSIINLHSLRQNLKGKT